MPDTMHHSLLLLSMEARTLLWCCCHVPVQFNMIVDTSFKVAGSTEIDLVTMVSDDSVTSTHGLDCRVFFWGEP